MDKGDRGEMKRKWQERLKKVEELASHYERNPLPTVYRPRLSKPSMPPSVWKIFSRQAEAFSYVKTCKEDVHVFALEKNTQTGQRFYLVTTYEQLWFYYTQGCKTSLMHCYEVIPEKDACKLYFDLEFYKPANPDADGKTMVMKLIELVSQKLKEFYDVNCSSEDVLNLDSSTDEKFSRHLIFLPQKTVFKDNTHIGNFVRTILQPAIRLMESRAVVIPAEEAGHVFQCSAGLDGSLTNLTAVEDDSKDGPAIAHETKTMEMPHQGENLDFSFLIVKDKEGNKQLFVDLGVYTKNRNFRMYKSSKAGKNVILKIAEDNKFVPNCEKDVSLEEAYFLSSLICNVGANDDIKVLSSGFSEERKMSAFLNSKTTRSSRGGPFVSCLSAGGRVHLPSPPVSTAVSLYPSSLCTLGVGWHCKDLQENPMEGYQGSPYPEIDNFVRSLVNKDGLQGGIRQWSYFSLKELLIYDISGYRWCENIGRAHKSNNIMYVLMSFASDSTRTQTSYSFSKINDVSDLSKSSVSPENSWSQDFLLSDSEWENTSDDACFLEAAEDVELAEAADDSLNYAMEEITDEVLLEALRKEDPYTKQSS
ncbi:DNA-directed primase/polymerase protein [Vidua chalybeata]|uniref:DNA-directed primase/polymerase protein n=1 Tax=Vidua chalybeata TaxID=81927 RepID=UPI0023A795EB|nr:DNA-directed primase/polymerase protein [Vidua chalybeata]